MNKTRLLAIALCTATAGVVLAYPHLPARQVPALVSTPLPKPATAAARAAHPKIEVVFVLDTTGSMSGLIQAAKENIWSIASSMASAQPAPEIRVGLVAYRDRGDAYVTRISDLSPDLDSMYATLMDYDADGGGDGPESVNQALNDAVNRISWSHDQQTYRVIFLVGDAPPHMDYPDDTPYPATLKVAAGRGIVVNTIQAGDSLDTRAEWKQIASLAKGEAFQVAQTGDAVAVATPYDDHLARLARELDDTRLFYGDEADRQVFESKARAIDKLRAGSSVAAQAKRAEFNASKSGAGNLYGRNELVDDVSSGRVDLATIDTKSLPEPLRAMKKDEQVQAIREAAGKRKAISDEIGTLSKQRQAFIASKLKDSEAKASLDHKIYDAVREQAASAGLDYETGPKY